MTQTKRQQRRPRAETPEPGTGEPATGEPGEDGEPATGEPGEGVTSEPEPDDDEAAEHEGERQPEPGSPEAQARKLDNAMRRYRRDVEGIIGPLDDAESCPYCDGFGFVPSRQALVHHPTKVTCTDCKGLGHMVTGSRAAGHETLPCPKCTGMGYVEPLPENVTPIVQQTYTQPAPAIPQVHGWFDPVTQTFHPYGEQAAT